MTIRSVIQRQIKTSPLTVAEIARRAGVHPTRISDYRRGVRDMNGETLDRLFGVLGVKLHVLRGRKNDK